MILEKLSKIEEATEKKIDKEYQKIASIRSMKEMLKQINFSVEIVRLEDYNDLIKLLASLKGKNLNKNECLLVKELLNKN